MSALALLTGATAADLPLRADAGRLHWRAEAPTAPDLLARLRRHKADLLALLTDLDEPAGILEFDAFPGAAAGPGHCQSAGPHGGQVRPHSYSPTGVLPMTADPLLQHAAAVVRDRRSLYGEALQLLECGR